MTHNAISTILPPQKSDFLSLIDPVLRLALGKGEACAAGQSILSRFEYEVVAAKEGSDALDGVFQRSIYPLIKKRSRSRLILDLDSTDVLIIFYYLRRN